MKRVYINLVSAFLIILLSSSILGFSISGAAQAESYDRSTELTSNEKAEALAIFLSSYNADNPYSTKDEELRQKAQARRRHWQGLKVAIKRPSKTSTNSIGMKFVMIPAGSFMMGSGISPLEVERQYGGEAKRYRNEHPRHRVTISKPFYMQTTEVTQRQWYEVMGTRPWSGRNFVRDNPDHPVVYISWIGCKVFIRRINQKEGGNRYRLPTEAEWEYACRAGSTTRFSFGDSKSKLGEYAWYDQNAWDVGEKYAHRVGSKKPNTWGLYDMHGNVWEWCQDWYGENYYSRIPKHDPKGRKKRVLRGGSWLNHAGDLRAAYRYGHSPVIRNYNLGFRVVRDF